jgi:hypothetical protein
MPDDDETEFQQRMDAFWLVLQEAAEIHLWPEGQWRQAFMRLCAQFIARLEDAARRPTEVRVAALVRECLVSDQPDALTD